MPWAAVATALAAGVNAGSSIYGASQQQDAGQNAINTQLGMFNSIRNDLAPYNMAGQGAVNALASYWNLGGSGGGTAGGPGYSSFQPTVPSGGLTYPNQAQRGNTPLQDIQAAQAMGKTITPAQWAQAGYGPNGPTSPSSLPSVAPGAAGGTPGTGGGPTAASGANAFSALQSYPGYQFQYDQGLQALDRNLSAAGKYTSGAMLKDAQTFGQGQAQSAVTNYLQMLQYLGTLGETAGAQTGSAGTAAGQGVAQTQLGIGTAGAAGTAGAGNALSGLLQNSNFQSLFSGNSGGYATLNPNTGAYTPGPNGFAPGQY